MVAIDAAAALNMEEWPGQVAPTLDADMPGAGSDKQAL